MCTGDLGDCDQTLICAARAAFLYSAGNPTGSVTTTSWCRKLLSSEQNKIKNLATENN
jgi:hypothetical protein